MGALVTSGVSLVKLAGLGMALAVLMDATLIRGLLVPAFMRLLGQANWWAPRPLRRLHTRFGAQHDETTPRTSAQ
jgi:RND superfamily putative drug exporter